MHKTMEQLPANVEQKLREHLELRSIRRRPKIYTDTYNSMDIDYGDVIHIDGRYFLITGLEREGRFGIDEQLKYWVKKAVDVESGERSILKCVFYETFDVTVGGFKINCFRNPEKEAQVLDLVRGHPHFMQGHGVLDETGNLIRILDIIRGQRLDKFIFETEGSHREYLEKYVPGILVKFLACTEAIGLLHANGLKHGDIRRDHILIDAHTGLFRWIDFDYDFHIPERPFALDLFGLGSILLFIVGRGNYRSLDVLRHPDMGQKVLDTITRDDLSLLFQDRIVNLKKLLPHIPKELNDILLHFSAGTNVFYDTVEEFYTDLKAYSDTLAIGS